MNDHWEQPKSQLLEYLPAIYQEGENPEQPLFLDAFLMAFEQLLLRPKGGAHSDSSRKAAGKAESLEEKIDRLSLLFDACETPEEFLPWLAGWVALNLHPELKVSARRKLLGKIVSLYRIRGTRRYLEELLELHLKVMPSIIEEEHPAFEVAEHSTIGMDTWLGGGPPHFFRVRLVSSRLDPAEQSAQTEIARSVIELAKPAHTCYELEFASPRMEIGVHSRIAYDTVVSP